MLSLKTINNQIAKPLEVNLVQVKNISTSSELRCSMLPKPYLRDKVNHLSWKNGRRKSPALSKPKEETKRKRFPSYAINTTYIKFRRNNMMLNPGTTYPANEVQEPSSIFEDLFDNEHSDLNGFATLQETKEACTLILEFVRKGEIPPARNMALLFQDIIINAFEGNSVLTDLEEEIDEYLDEPDTLSEMNLQHTREAVRNLQKKLERWYGQSVQMPE